MTLREKRLRETTNALTRTVAQRDGCLTNLVRYETRLKTLRKQVQRLERAMAAAPKPPKAKGIGAVLCTLETKPPATDVTNIPVSELSIPDFLDRRKATERKDAEAANTIRKEQAERKANKARGRIETMKAKQRGDLKRMPLTGKAALAAIRG